jgi:hypothetical protein
MLTKDLEAKDTWQATFRITRRGEFDCLMRTSSGGYYWHTPNYTGLFVAGATRNYDASMLRESLADGTMVLVAGELPS